MEVMEIVKWGLQYFVEGQKLRLGVLNFAQKLKGFPELCPDA